MYEITHLHQVHPHHQRLGRTVGIFDGQQQHLLLWDNVPDFVMPTKHGAQWGIRNIFYNSMKLK